MAIGSALGRDLKDDAPNPSEVIDHILASPDIGPLRYAARMEPNIRPQIRPNFRIGFGLPAPGSRDPVRILQDNLLKQIRIAHGLP